MVADLENRATAFFNLLPTTVTTQIVDALIEQIHSVYRGKGSRDYRHRTAEELSVADQTHSPGSPSLPCSLQCVFCSFFQ